MIRLHLLRYIVVLFILSKACSEFFSESYDSVLEFLGDINAEGFKEKERFHLQKYGYLSPLGFLVMFRSRLKGEYADIQGDMLSIMGNFTSHELNLIWYFKSSEILNWEMDEISQGMNFVCDNWNGLICHERIDNGLESTCWCVDDYELQEYSWSPSSDSKNETCIQTCKKNELGRYHAKNQAPYDAITKIDLEGWQLVGQMIPVDIISLRFLELIDLHGNHLVGTLPPTFGDLEGLGTLDLSGCYLFRLPEEVGKLRNLHYLSVNSCDLLYLPTSLGLLPNLKVLSASGNRFSDWHDISDFIFSMTSLEYLDLSEMGFVADLSKDFSKLINLKTLDLEQNYFEGTLPLEISTMPLLQTLKLSGNSLNGTLPIEWTSSIEKIDLAANHFTGTIPSTIFQPALVELLLYGNELTGTIPTEIKNSHLLSSLEIDDNMIRGTLPISIKEFPYLVNFEIDGNFIEGPLDEDMCHQINLSDRTAYPFEYVNFSCTHFIACPKGFVSSLGFATDFESCVPCSSCNDISDLDDTYCEFLGQSVDRCHDYGVQKVGTSGLLDRNYESPIHQRELLKSVFVKMQGYSWNNTFQIWGDMRHSDECTLPGIICTDQLVVSIDLRYAGFCANAIGDVCEIPEEIGFFDSLQVLDLSDVSFSKRRLVLPKSVKFLKKLTTLSLSNNLIHNMPKELLECKNLNNLFMINCGPIQDFENAIFWGMESLKVLDLESAQLGNQNIPTKIGLMTELEYLKMNNAGLVGSIPSEIGNLSKLMVLDLHNNYLTGYLPAAFSNFQMMDKLDLYNNNFRGTINIITLLKKLKILNLNSNNFDGTIPSEIDKLESLFWIDLGLNNFYGVIPISFVKMTMLMHLRLGGNNFHPFIDESLCQLAVNDGPFVNGSCEHLLCPLNTYSQNGFASKDSGCRKCPEGSITKTVGSVDVSSCFSLSEYDHLFALRKAISSQDNDSVTKEEFFNNEKNACEMKELDVQCDSEGRVTSFSIPLSSISFEDDFPIIKS